MPFRADPARRRALELVAAVLAAAGLLAVVFWIIRDRPEIPACFVELSGSQEVAIDRYRAGAQALHLLASAPLMVALWRLSAARQHSSRPGHPTLVALGGFGVLLAATLASPGVLAAVGVFSFFLSFVLVPLTVVVLIPATVLLLFRATRGPGIGFALVAGWLALLLLLPAHYSDVWLIDEPFCMS